MAPVHSRESRVKKITISLTDKLKLLKLHKQKPKLVCRPLDELLKRLAVSKWVNQKYESKMKELKVIF